MLVYTCKPRFNIGLFTKKRRSATGMVRTPSLGCRGLFRAARAAARTRFFLFLGFGRTAGATAGRGFGRLLRTAGTAASGRLLFGFCRAARTAARAGGLVGEGGYKTSEIRSFHCSKILVRIYWVVLNDFVCPRECPRNAPAPTRSARPNAASNFSRVR